MKPGLIREQSIGSVCPRTLGREGFKNILVAAVVVVYVHTGAAVFIAGYLDDEVGVIHAFEDVFEALEDLLHLAESLALEVGVDRFFGLAIFVDVFFEELH